MQPLEAAIALVSHVVTENGEVAPCAGTHVWMEDERIVGSITTPPGRFLSHWKAQLRDSVDGTAVITHIHQFTLPPEDAEDINGPLRKLGARKYAARDGINRSNEGGYHSIDDIFDPDDESAWYRHVQDATLAALAIVEPAMVVNSADTAITLDSVASFKAARAVVCNGWLNASDNYDFNTLHHHGGRKTDFCKWSAVYFVDGGDATLDTDENAGLLGALLLQAQPNPELSAFEFMPIAPVPGSLWVFPAYLSHAVMPRALLPLGSSIRTPAEGEQTPAQDAQTWAEGMQASAVGKPGAARRLRISVAINIMYNWD